jgi:predicted TIM-barrel fold metal-dependent hydrolase
MESVDCHAHVFETTQPLAGDRRYTPVHNARIEQYLARLDANSIGRGVLVQPSFLGTDNSYMCAALRAHPQRLRGIAVVEPGIGAAALDALGTAGVVGIRLNLIGRELCDLRATSWRELIEAVAQRGWQVEVHRQAADLPRLIPALLEAGVKVVVDHFGRPDPALGVDDPGFRYLLSLGGSGRVWVKLSGAYRNVGNVDNRGHGSNGDSLAQTATALLQQSFGFERLVWGSDWPHTLFEDEITYEKTRAQLDTWIPDPSDRHVVLCAAPTALYGFSEPAAAA